MKSGNLNFVEPSGPLQASNGTTLLYFNILYVLLLIIHQVFCVHCKIVYQWVMTTRCITSSVHRPTLKNNAFIGHFGMVQIQDTISYFGLLGLSTVLYQLHQRW